LDFFKNPDFFKRINLIWPVQSPFAKIFLFSRTPNQIWNSRHPGPQEGRIAIVTDAAWRGRGSVRCRAGLKRSDVLVSRRYFLGHAHDQRARFGNALAIIRCGEPVQLQFLEGFFACNRAEEPVVGQSHGRFANCAMME
jgi:hypothetical protein